MEERRRGAVLKIWIDCALPRHSPLPSVAERHCMQVMYVRGTDWRVLDFPLSFASNKTNHAGRDSEYRPIGKLRSRVEEMRRQLPR